MSAEEIDVDEFLDACSTHEINEVVEWLQNGDYIKMSHLINDSRMSMGDLEYIKIINKLKLLIFSSQKSRVQEPIL